MRRTHGSKAAVAAIGVATLIASLTACSSDKGGSEGGATTTSAVTTTSKPPAKPPAYAAKVSADVRKIMKEGSIPGVVVLIRSPELGDWSQAFGTRTIGKDDPIQVTDRFRVGSNTKTMTGTVILQLVQEGKLALDDPVSKYIDGVPGGDAITIANLLEMRSGLPTYSNDKAFNATLDADPAKVWTPQELLDIAYAKPATAKPGEKFGYSNTNTVLLGLIIEKLTKMSASEAFQERIFDKLDMKDSKLPEPDDATLGGPHPHGYMFGTNVSTADTAELSKADQAAAAKGTLLPGDFTDDNPSWGWTAGSAVSTADDLATYVKAMVGGGLLDDKVQKERIDSLQSSDPTNPKAAGYGLALAQFGPQIGHDGQLPGYMSFMGYDPDRDLTIIVLTNLTATPDGQGSALPIAKAIIGELYPS